MKVIPISFTTKILLLIVSLIGFIAFFWPFLISRESVATQKIFYENPYFLIILIPFALFIALSNIFDNSIGSKILALLGVMVATIAIIRPLGGSAAGLEPVWAFLIIGARAMGPGFGFSLGAMGLLVSAFVTGGVGPWLPYQMMVAAWIGLGAGLLPRVRSMKVEITMLSIYGGISAFIAGLLLNLWFWPIAVGIADELTFQANATVGENLFAWIRFTIVTSLGFDTIRAITTIILLALATKPLLRAMRRLTNKMHVQHIQSTQEQYT